MHIASQRHIISRLFAIHHSSSFTMSQLLTEDDMNQLNILSKPVKLPELITQFYATKVWYRYLAVSRYIEVLNQLYGHHKWSLVTSCHYKAPYAPPHSSCTICTPLPCYVASTESRGARGSRTGWRRSGARGSGSRRTGATKGAGWRRAKIRWREEARGIGSRKAGTRAR